MKILLLAWPRTGSKAVHENLCNYVNQCTSSNIKTTEGYELFVNEDNIKNSLEVVKSKDSFVVKIHPHEKKYSFEVLRNIAKHFDYTIILDRDRFDQETSRLVCNRTTFFSNNEDQVNAKNNAESYLFIADVEEFKKKVTEVRYLDWPHCHIPNSHNVMFEDFVNVSNSKEFCKWLQLEEVDFNYYPGSIEYSESKEKMISNYKELHNWYITRK